MISPGGSGPAMLAPNSSTAARRGLLDLLQLPLQLLHHQPHVVEAGPRQGLHPRLHGCLALRSHLVHPRFGAVKLDGEGELLSRLAQLHGAPFQDDDANGLPAVALLEVEEHVGLQDEPAAVIRWVALTLFEQEAGLVRRGVTGGIMGHAAFVQPHLLPSVESLFTRAGLQRHMSTLREMVQKFHSFLCGQLTSEEHDILIYLKRKPHHLDKSKG